MGTRALVSVAGGLLLLFNMNKFLAVLCLAAAVAAEADPYILGYGGYGGYGMGYSGLQGLGYAGVNGLGYAGIGGYGGYGYASPVHHGYNHVANTQVSPSASLSIAGAAPAAVPGVVGARTYAGAGRYVANSAGTVHVAKREADPYYAGYAGLGYTGYGGYGGYGLGYGSHIGYAGYGGYGHGYGVVNLPVHRWSSPCCCAWSSGSQNLCWSWSLCC